MAKRRHKLTAVYPDEQQRSLEPGTEEYRQRKAMQRLREAYTLEEDTDEEKQAAPAPAPVPEKQTEPYDPAQNMAHDVAVRKFRRKRSKERKAGLAKEIAKDAIHKDIPVHNVTNLPGIRSMDEELYDDGIDEKAFVSDVLRDYDEDLKELIKQDNNGDGKVDEEDLTPAMRRMKRYM